MAMAMVRGRILGGFRLQSVDNLLARRREILGGESNLLPPKSQNRHLFQVTLFDSKDQAPKEFWGSSSASDDQIKGLTSYVTSTIDGIVKYGKPPFPIVFGAEVYVDVKYSTTPQDKKFKIVSKLLDEYVQFIPGIDQIQVFHAKIFYRSMLNDDSKCVLVKDDIIARVVNVTQSYPKVSNYKITEETHFIEDLGLDKWDSIEIIQALQVEFKLYIPDDIVSCKLAIDYICDHSTERLSKEEFQRHIILTEEFGESESHSKLRRIFVRDKAIETNYDKSDSRHFTVYSESANWKGFKPIQYFQDIIPSSFDWLI